MLVTCGAMSEAERLFFADRSPEPWMDEAGRLCAAAILDFFPEPGRAEVFCGRGNNGGDALVVARWLRRHGWSVTLHFPEATESLPDLPRKKLAEFEAEPPHRFGDWLASRPTIVVDGLVGIGAKGGLRGPIREMAARINEFRLRESATVFAIDLPSGFDADSGVAGANSVVADVTLSITAAKVGFATDAAANSVGRLVEIPLDIPLPEGDGTKRFLFPSNLRLRLPRRRYDTHKGAAGRVAIVAGGRGLTGAAVLAALGASRGGAGLVTLCVPEESYPIVASRAPAEVMVRPIRSFGELAELGADALAIGPGLGPTPPPGMVEFLIRHPAPLVIDADALNGLALCPGSLAELPPNRLLTPHPGEMERLFPKRPDEDRCRLARRFAEGTGTTLLLKGARSVIASPQRPLELNTTGHPGMASGGMGDVLSGLCAALVAQGLELHDAASLGSWLLGRAAELALRDEHIAPESLSAPMVAEDLGRALRALRKSGSI
jgi:hydroxyethylthiazole kinase-like uncharacterized protein yjeF